MNPRSVIGKEGEKQALNYLREEGYVILETNWRYRRTEVDIIAKKHDVIVFIEVKTRTNVDYGYPETFVGRKKEEQLHCAASAYQKGIKEVPMIRFDIISLIYKGGRFEIEHFEDAVG